MASTGKFGMNYDEFDANKNKLYQYVTDVDIALTQWMKELDNFITNGFPEGELHKYLVEFRDVLNNQIITDYHSNVSEQIINLENIANLVKSADGGK